MPKFEIEIDGVPTGWKPIAYRNAKKDEIWLSGEDRVSPAMWNMISPVIILVKESDGDVQTCVEQA